MLRQHVLKGTCSKHKATGPPGELHIAERTTQITNHFPHTVLGWMALGIGYGFGFSFLKFH